MDRLVRGHDHHSGRQRGDAFNRSCGRSGRIAWIAKKGARFRDAIALGQSHIVRADPPLMRLMGYGLLNPNKTIPGAAVAGRVEAVGSNAKQFKPGDEVFGDLSFCGLGAFAEYVCASENALALKPTNSTFEEAAAVPLAATTALQALRDNGHI